MLVMTDLETRYYLIAVNEVTSVAELIADLSYLDELPPGNLTLDFTYAAANVTQAIAAQHIPGHFGFHPLNHIIEQLSFIGRLAEMPLLASCCHEISVTLPVSSSHLGRFFVHLGVSELLNQWGLKVDTRDIWEPKGARDDDSRCAIIPLTDIKTGYAGCPCDNHITQIRQRITDPNITI
jgi:hypothetical protein